MSIGGYNDDFKAKYPSKSISLPQIVESTRNGKHEKENTATKLLREEDLWIQLMCRKTVYLTGYNNYVQLICNAVWTRKKHFREIKREK